MRRSATSRGLASAVVISAAFHFPATASAGSSLPLLPFVREIRISSSAAGWVETPLDTAVYSRLAPDLGNLRIADDRGAEIPWLRESPPPPSWVDAAVPAKILDRAFVRGSQASLVLDLGSDHVAVNRLVVPTSGEEFARRVTVEGRDGSDAWQTIRDDGYVFRIRAEGLVANDAVTVPDCAFHELRVTVHDDARGEREPIRVGDVSALRRETTLRAEQTFEARVASEGERKDWTLLNLEFGAPHLPIERLFFDAEDPNFVRTVDVHENATEVQTSPIRLGDGTIHAVAVPGRGMPVRDEGVPIDRPSTSRLMVRIWNGDSPPLHVVRVMGTGPVEKLVFLAEPDRTYRLYLGGRRVRAPRYDLAAVLARTGGAKERSTAVLGPVLPNAAYRVPILGDRAKSILLWVSMFVAVGGLALVLARVVRKATADVPGPPA